jgi:peptidoglycan/LPS O-acetylase OafA/YrhL
MSSYLIAVFLSLIIGLALAALWARKRRPDLVRNLTTATAVSIVVFAIIALWKSRREKQ